MARAAICTALTVITIAAWFTSCAGAAETIEAHECLARGFDPVALSCATCTILEAHIADDNDLGATMRRECRSCCNRDLNSKEDSASARAVRAVIEHDPRWLRGSALDAFGEKYLSKYAGTVTMRPRANIMPRILLFTETSGEKASETINVSGWEAALIDEFLANKFDKPRG
jgi:hypothetical protein